MGVRVVASGSAIIWMSNPICIMKGLNSKGFMRSSRTIMKTIKCLLNTKESALQPSIEVVLPQTDKPCSQENIPGPVKVRN